MENKLKHLEFIQAIINRMANTSFLIKGWAITLATGLFGFGIKEGRVEFIYLTVFVALVFWTLDAFFIKQERLFRCLYDEVRKKTPEQIDFSMHTKHFKGWANSLLNTFITPTVAILYLAIVACALVAICN